MTLPDPNRLVVAFLEGEKCHSGVGFMRNGWAFMVRWTNAPVKDVVLDDWASDRYYAALKLIGADYAVVTEWVYVSDLHAIATKTEREL